MSTLPEATSGQAIPRQSSPAGRASSRAAKWLVGLAAFALVTVSIAGYLFHRFQMASIAAKHLRLMVIGPSTLQTGVSAQFDISTTEVTGAPVSIPVEVDLYSPEGKRLLGRKESTDRQGRLQVTIPADMSLPAKATLKTAALHRGSREETSVPLAVEPTRLLTQLSLDKPLYQPGETIFYRSLTLSRFGLSVEREIPIRYEILDPGGAAAANSQSNAATDHGVGNGAFTIPLDSPGGQYALLARSSDVSFPDEKLKFLVRRYRLPRLKTELEFLRGGYAPGDTVVADFSAKHADGEPAAAAKLRLLASVDGQTVLENNLHANNEGKLRIEFILPEKIARGEAQLAVTVDDSGTRETVAKVIPINLGKVEVHFYPEGGELTAGLENRVYFVCRNPLGKPVHISGVIINDNDQVTAAAETVHEGMGQFSFTPQPGQSYRLKIIAPAEIKEEPKLPAASADCPVVLTTGTGVFDPAEPLEFNIRSSKAGLPLVVGAWCRGVLAGQVALVTKKSENGMNPVVLPLPDEAGGVIRLTVFDYNINPDQSKTQFPKPLAERLVYRRMDKRLNVRAVDNREHYAPGEKVNMSLVVTNEKNEPVAAAVGASVIDETLLALAGDRTPNMPTYFLLAAELDNPEDLENADFYLSDDTTSSLSPGVALDLLLGTQGWRRFVEKTGQQQKEAGPEKDDDTLLAAISGSAGPPAMSDNLDRIRADYKKSLAAYHTDRTQILYTVITVSFVAACGLLLMVLMLGLLRIIRGASLWLPVLGTIGSCTLIGALLTDPQRFAGENEQAVPFLSYHARWPAAESKAKNDVETRKKSPEEKVAEKPGPPQTNRRSEGAGIAGQPAQLEQVISCPNQPRDEKASPGPIQPTKTDSFIIRQYAHQHVAGRSGGQGDFAETLFWNPLMIASPDGKVPLSFDLSDSITTFRLRADAHGAGRIGSVRVEISTQPPLKIESK